MAEPKTSELFAPTVVQQLPVPDAIRALVPDHDYVDVFTATATKAAATAPEQWARTAIENASAVGRFLAWQAVLHLRLDRQRSPDYIGGWKIGERGDDWIRLDASSWFMTAHMVFRVEEAQVSFATFVRYDRPLAALIWTPVSAVHRSVAPGFLAAAVRRVTGSRGGRTTP